MNNINLNDCKLKSEDIKINHENLNDNYLKMNKIDTKINLESKLNNDSMPK